MRVIFLDIDGCLHPIGTMIGAHPPLTPAEIREGWPEAFSYSHRLVELLKKHPDVRIVVSSSWRTFLDDSELGQVLNMFSGHYLCSVGMPYRGRELAIRTWLESNPTTTDHIIIDDEKNFFPGEWPHLILCNPQKGISDDLVCAAISQWLENSRP